MDIGIILLARTNYPNPTGVELGAVYRDFIDDVIVAEQEYGFDFVNTTEHHFASDAWSPSQLPILAHIAGRTSTIELGTEVFLMPFHNPLRVAEDVATVDILSNGRFTSFISGSGSVRDEFDSYNIDPAERWGRLFESLEIIRRCFSEESFDHQGKYFRFPDVRITTKPVQDPFPLWVGGFGPKLIERAGREAYHLQTFGGPHLVNYLDALRANGHNPDDFNQQTFSMGHVSDTTDKAWDEAEIAFHYWQNFYRGRDWIAFENQTIPELPPVGEFRNHPEFGAVMPVGSPDDVLRKLEPLLKGSRMTHYAFGFRGAGMQTPIVRHSMELFAREVMPTLRTWGRAPVDKKR